MASLYTRKVKIARNGRERTVRVYYVKFKRHGKWYYKSLKTRNRRKALEEKKILEAGLLADSLTADRPAPNPNPVGVGQTLTFADLEKRFGEWSAANRRANTTELRAWAMKLWRGFCTIERIDQVLPDDVEDWKRYLRGRERPLSPRSVNDAIDAMAQIVGRAIKEKWYFGPNPFQAAERLKLVKKKPRYLDRAQGDRVLEVAELYGRDEHLFVALCLLAGLRKQEALAARWEWFCFYDAKQAKAAWVDGLIKIQASERFQIKDAEERTIPMNARLRAILERYRAESGYVIRPERTEWKDRYRVNNRKSFAAIVKAAKVPWATPHTLRHTFASWLVNAGVDVYKVSHWLGHADVATTRIYAHLRPGDPDINRI